MMFKNLSLRIKLIFAFLLIAGLLAGASYYQVSSVRHLNTLFQDLIDNDFERLVTLKEVELTSVQLRDQTFEYQHNFENQADGVQDEKQTLANLSKKLKGDEKAYQELIDDDDPNVNEQQLAAVSDAVDLVILWSNEVINATGANHDQPNPDSPENKLARAQDQLADTLSSIIAAEQKGIGREAADAEDTVRRLLAIIVALAAIVTVLAVTLGLSVAAWISRSLLKLRVGAERIAGGDFSHPIDSTSTDEIGQLAATFNVMAEKLSESYQKLALESQRDDAILQNMGEGLLALDAKGRITLLNRVAAAFFAVEDISTVIGENVEEAMRQYRVTDINDKSLTFEQTPSYKTITEGLEVSETLVFHSKDNKKRLFYITSSPVKMENKVVGAVVVFRDITKEKEIDRMKTEFISLASHQLRTPLSAIKWFSEMLVSGDAGKLQPEQLDFAKNIADSTERMIALVNALLNISRIESGRIVVDPKPTDLRKLVSGIVNDLKAKTEEKQQTLVISALEGLPNINLDPRLIGQVYLNLLTNAIKYTPKGGEISVFISKKDNQIISQVTDNGYGIPADQQTRIFQKFFRAANAVKVETDGTGLGLYLIKAIVESSGGKIWFKSDEGKGTSFWFSIPLSGMEPKEGEVTLDA